MLRKTLAAVALTLAALGSSSWSSPLYNDNIVCNLKITGSGYYEGDCYIPNQVNDLAVNFDGLNTQYTKAYFPDRRVNVRLHKDKKGNLTGQMQGRKVEDPTLFEVVYVKGKPSYGKLPYGWFNVKKSSVSDKEANFVFDASRQSPPTPDDLKIIKRAKELISSPSKWNRKDNRQCKPTDETYSIFCAMMKAQNEILEQPHYRQPAMQAFREVLNTMGQGRFDKHRLQDWNNHPDTTFEEVQKLFDVTYERLDTLMKEKR